MFNYDQHDNSRKAAKTVQSEIGKSSIDTIFTGKHVAYFGHYNDNKDYTLFDLFTQTEARRKRSSAMSTQPSYQ